MSLYPTLEDMKVDHMMKVSQSSMIYMLQNQEYYSLISLKLYLR